MADADSYHAARALFEQKRFAEALSIYEGLANAGDPQSQVHVGWMYHEGLGTASNKEKACSWFHRAASLGSKEGAFYYGRAIASDGRYEEAIPWFLKAAAADYSPAQFWLGLAYIRGLGVSADFDKGVGYLQRSANAGNIFAKKELALLMSQGRFGLFKVPGGFVYLIYVMVSGILLAIFDTYSDKLRA